MIIPPASLVQANVHFFEALPVTGHGFFNGPDSISESRLLQEKKKATLYYHYMAIISFWNVLLVCAISLALHEPSVKSVFLRKMIQSSGRWLCIFALSQHSESSHTEVLFTRGPSAPATPWICFLKSKAKFTSSINTYQILKLKQTKLNKSIYYLLLIH